MTASWSEGLIESECAAPYADYVRTVEHHYHEYFHAHPELGTGHPLLACDLDATLPHGWSQLQGLIEPAEWHRWHLSAKSSQTLAIGRSEQQPTLTRRSHG